VSNQTNSNSEKDYKLEDILSSIRGIIDNQDSFEDELSNKTQDKKHDEAILELVRIAENDDSSPADGADVLLSQDTISKAEIQFKRFSESIIDKKLYEDSNDSLDDKVSHIMRPFIKEWLDNNLPRIVEKVVSNEIKRIIPKS
jgi:cell pole-organizing protein PopZ